MASNCPLISISIGGKPCTSVQLVSVSEIRCTAPRGIGRGLSVIITINGLTNEANQLFNYKPPIITSVSPTQSLGLPGDQLTLCGRNFGMDTSDVSVRFIPLDSNFTTVQADDSTWQSNTIIFCYIPQNLPPMTFKLVITVGEQISNESVTYRNTNTNQGPTARMPESL